MQQLYLVAVLWKWYGDEVCSRMFHLVNLLPDAVGGVPDRCNENVVFKASDDNLSVEMLLIT